MAKSNKATMNNRVQEVLRLTLAGGEFAEIQQYAAQQGWNVEKRQLRRYLELAYQELGETAQRDRQHLIGRHLLQRRALYARCLKANDIRTALQVLKDEAALLGLYAPTKIAPTTPDGKALSFDQRQIHIDAILVEKFGMTVIAENKEPEDDTGTIEASFIGSLGRTTDADESPAQICSSGNGSEEAPSSAN